MAQVSAFTGYLEGPPGARQATPRNTYTKMARTSRSPAQAAAVFLTAIVQLVATAPKAALRTVAVRSATPTSWPGIHSQESWHLRREDQVPANQRHSTFVCQSSLPPSVAPPEGIVMGKRAMYRHKH